jgi:hypothetical protein
MQYNTLKPKLIIPEYGRNVQTLIDHAKTIEDRPERQAFVEEIVNLVQQMHPQARNMDDYRSKLWSHVLRIGEYELDIDIPDNVSLEPIEKKRPNTIPYPDGNVRYRHYGKNVQEMIKKAIDMEDEDKQAEFIGVIGAYMKMAYKSWNQPVVSDENILRDLKELSDGALDFGDEITLDNIYNYRKRRTSDNNGRRDSRDSRDNNRRPGGYSNDRRINDRRNGPSNGRRNDGRSRRK